MYIMLTADLVKFSEKIKFNSPYFLYLPADGKIAPRFRIKEAFWQLNI